MEKDEYLELADYQLHADKYLAAHISDPKTKEGVIALKHQADKAYMDWQLAHTNRDNPESFQEKKAREKSWQALQENYVGQLSALGFDEKIVDKEKHSLELYREIDSNPLYSYNVNRTAYIMTFPQDVRGAIFTQQDKMDNALDRSVLAKSGAEQYEAQAQWMQERGEYINLLKKFGFDERIIAQETKNLKEGEENTKLLAVQSKINVPAKQPITENPDGPQIIVGYSEKESDDFKKKPDAEQNSLRAQLAETKKTAASTTPTPDEPAIMEAKATPVTPHKYPIANETPSSAPVSVSLSPPTKIPGALPVAALPSEPLAPLQKSDEVRKPTLTSAAVPQSPAAGASNSMSDELIQLVREIVSGIQHLFTGAPSDSSPAVAHSPTSRKSNLTL